MESFGGVRRFVVNDREPKVIASQLKAFGIRSVHCTNGTFTMPPQKIVPTMLAGFRYVVDDWAKRQTCEDAALVVAINSDISMQRSYAGKDNERALLEALKPEALRAAKIAKPLHDLFPDRAVVITFYDEDTPEQLYAGLADAGIWMLSLHKWSYGTSSDDKPIIGAGNFADVYAFPLPTDEKPVMYTQTRDTNKTDRHADFIVKLTEETGPHGKPYMTPKGGLLFPLPVELFKYNAWVHEGFPLPPQHR